MMNINYEQAASIAAGKLRQLANAAQSVIDGGRNKYFNTNKKGENFELKNELNSDMAYKRKEAVKKVIANMTVGKDVSGLFADVLKNIQTEDLELKKLVYLYLMNYSKSQPELVILAVNTFCKDTEDKNPLIRALAIRTMGCLRVDKIIDYLCEPLRKALADENPYVRKTAAICVAKLFDLSPSLAEENGFISTLQNMLGDSNPAVVSNAVAALTEIHSSDPEKNALTLNSTILNKLLTALNECTEWGQITILDTLAEYRPVDFREGELIIERVLPRLQHANGAVVLSAVKVLILYTDRFVQNEDIIKQAVKKMTPPLVTLLSSIPEVQYVALRNLRIILQKRPDILGAELRVFFCKFNDPPYVKLEKLDIIVKLCNEGNLDQVLAELKEYANEVDVEFVRTAIRSIGKCAVRVNNSADKCIAVLVELIKTKINYVVQETVIVLKDIFRKYSTGYEGLIPVLCENIESLDEPEARAAMIWIIGEYAEKIENAGELLDFFGADFEDDSHQVQLQLLTALVKLFLKRPGPTQALVQKYLKLVTDNMDDADLRDRAYIYWRLLSVDPKIAQAVVLAARPPVRDDSDVIHTDLLEQLVENIGTLAAVYLKTPSSFIDASNVSAPILSMKDVKSQLKEATLINPEDVDSNNVITGQNIIENLLDLDFGAPAVQPSANASSAAAAPVSNPIMDLLGDDFLGLGMGAAHTATPPVNQVAQNAFGAHSSPLASNSPSSPSHAKQYSLLVLPKSIVLPAQQGQGLEISATMSRRSHQIYLDFTFTNRSGQPLSDFAIQFNKNSFGLVPSAPLQVASPLAPGASYDTSLPLATNGPLQKMDPITILQVAVKNNVQVFYFGVDIPLNVVSVEEAPVVDASTFQMAWNSSPPPPTGPTTFSTTALNLEDVKARLQANNFHVVKTDNQRNNVSFVAKFTNNFTVMAELELQAGNRVQVTGRSQVPEFIHPPLYKIVEAISNQ